MSTIALPEHSERRLTLPEQLYNAQAENESMRALLGLSATAPIPTPAAHKAATLAARPVVAPVAAVPVALTKSQAVVEYKRLIGTGDNAAACAFYSKNRALIVGR